MKSWKIETNIISQPKYALIGAIIGFLIMISAIKTSEFTNIIFETLFGLVVFISALLITLFGEKREIIVNPKNKEIKIKDSTISKKNETIFRFDDISEIYIQENLSDTRDIISYDIIMRINTGDLFTLTGGKYYFDGRYNKSKMESKLNKFKGYVFSNYKA